MVFLRGFAWDELYVFAQRFLLAGRNVFFCRAGRLVASAFAKKMFFGDIVWLFGLSLLEDWNI